MIRIGVLSLALLFLLPFLPKPLCLQFLANGGSRSGGAAIAGAAGGIWLSK